MRTLIDLTKKKDFISKGKDFNKNNTEITKTKKAYDAFIKSTNNSNLWKIFKDDFLEETSNCPYCGRDLDQWCDIDHYRPKNHYWWLAYNYENYVIACKLCNSKYKRKHFPLYDETTKVVFSRRNQIQSEQPLIFNPLKHKPVDFFELEFRLSTSSRYIVKFRPLSTLASNSYEYKLACKTIELLNLNNDSRDDKRREDYAMKFFLQLRESVRLHREYLASGDQNKLELLMDEVKRTRVAYQNDLALLIPKHQYIYDEKMLN